MKNYFDFTDKNILILGASSGIGKCTTELLSEFNANVILVARREEKLSELCNSLNSKSKYFAMDVRNSDNIDTLFNFIQKDIGKLDGMVYSVGVSMSMPLQMFKPEKLQELFSINFFPYIECIRQATKKGRFNSGMKIVGISSVASIKGDKTHLGYCASKAAMDASIRCIAKEIAPKGICINNIAPGLTGTEMYQNFSSNIGAESESMKELLNRQYLGIIQPEDVANAVAFLLSPAARAITGITLPVDGGMTTN